MKVNMLLYLNDADSFISIVVQIQGSHWIARQYSARTSGARHTLFPSAIDVTVVSKRILV